MIVVCGLALAARDDSVGKSATRNVCESAVTDVDDVAANFPVQSYDLHGAIFQFAFHGFSKLIFDSIEGAGLKGLNAQNR